MVVGGRDLDQIHAHQVDALQPANNLERTVRTQPADDRGAGARGEAWVEAVDVEGQVAGGVPDTLVNALGDGRYKTLYHGGAMVSTFFHFRVLN